MVYDKKQKLKARIVENRVYDNRWNYLWFVIDGDKVYDGRENLKYKIDSHKIFDMKQNLKYYTVGDSLSQCRWNSQRLR